MSVLAGYPTSWGNCRVAIATLRGPAPYAAYTAPLTGGQQINLFGLTGQKGIDRVLMGITTDGLYMVIPVAFTSGLINGQAINRQTVILQWRVLSTGAEAGAIDLSGSTVELLVLSQK